MTREELLAFFKRLDYGASDDALGMSIHGSAFDLSDVRYLAILIARDLDAQALRSLPDHYNMAKEDEDLVLRAADYLEKKVSD